ncbi:LexA/Signal peptidase, partial [Piedraia hortae CBS 480.64]
HIFIEYVYSIEPAWGISMLPTIPPEGQALVISKYERRGRGVGIGDLVTFKHPVREGDYALKRVIGMPGDFVVGNSSRNKMLQVPEGHCWVTGDNLTWSRDSRMYGPLPLALITGRVVATFPGISFWKW